LENPMELDTQYNCQRTFLVNTKRKTKKKNSNNWALSWQF